MDLNKSQAAHSLRGFRYQLLQSVDAWLSLELDEELWLEVSEDFSIVGDGSEIDVQVKSSSAAKGPTKHSLQTKGVRDALLRFWLRSDGGRNGKHHLTFLAQGGAAKEIEFSFPGSVPGLIYWQRAAIDADTAPLRSALANVFKDEPLGRWIAASPDDNELRSRLLRRVRWALESLDAESLSVVIQEKVAALYLTKGLMASAAVEGVRSLVDRTFETACKTKPAERRLTKIDLHNIIEQAIQPIAALNAIVRITSAQPTLVDGALVTLLGDVRADLSNREVTVSAILEQTKGEPLIWLHGAHGTGKSTLARLLASRSGGQWLLVDLRPVQEDGLAALAAWRELLMAVARRTRVAGIIVDDLGGAAF